MSFICGVVMMVFGLLFSRQCLNMIGVPSDIINDATAYMKLYFLSMIPGVIYNIGAGILRAIGDSKTPLYYLIICSGVNVFFDLLFVAYFQDRGCWCGNCYSNCAICMCYFSNEKTDEK